MNALIAFSLRQRVLVVLLFVVMLGIGYGAYTQLNIEAQQALDSVGLNIFGEL